VKDTESGCRNAPNPVLLAIITGVSIHDFSSEIVTAVDRRAVYLIDGSGFTEATGHHVTGPDGTMWTTAGNFAGEPGSPDPLPVHVTFNLGANYDLNSIKIWNFNGSGVVSAGAKDISISVATSDVGPLSVIKSGIVLAQATRTNDVDFGQVVDLTSGVNFAAKNIRLVRIDITTNHGFTHLGTELVGLSEVRFDGVTAIPEPGSLTLLSLVGLCVLRRRRG